MKTLTGWRESGKQLTPYLNTGDEVEEAFADWALNIMPPACWRPDLIQIGEPHSHVDGRATFATFHRQGRTWYFAGHCHRGKIAEPHLLPSA
jgi:hypothetical protein